MGAKIPKAGSVTEDLRQTFYGSPLDAAADLLEEAAGHLYAAGEYDLARRAAELLMDTLCARCRP